MNRYFDIPYVAGGRSHDGIDCWGLVRLARVELFGKSELPLYSNVSPTDKKSLTKSTNDCIEVKKLQKVEIREGAIATAWHGGLCVHVGIVVFIDGRLWVLETDKPTGVCLTIPDVFADRYARVEFYDD